jgi:hypothetical protein
VLFGVPSRHISSLFFPEPRRERPWRIPAQWNIAGILFAVLITGGGCIVVPSETMATFDSPTGCHSTDCGATVCDPYLSARPAADHTTPECADAHAGPAIGRGESIAGHHVLAATLSVAGTALGTVGHVANFCLPPAAIGPPDGLPPGRFHPVPTRPVFYPVSGP